METPSNTSGPAQSDSKIESRITANLAYDRKANLIGSIWMIASMAVFAIEDAFVKAASASLPVGQILTIFGIGGAVVFACLMRFNGEPLFIQRCGF